MTDQQPDLDAIQARLDAASKGPWKLAYEYCDCSEDCGHGLYVSRIDTGSGPATELCDLPRGEWELMVHARQDVEDLVAEVRRLRAELADFSGRVNELESKLCDCEPVREHDDYKRPAFYQHEAHCPVTELDHADTQPATERRTLTESEHDRAWHAIEGAAGEEGADPGTVLNAVLRALDLNPPAAPAARSAAV